MGREKLCDATLGNDHGEVRALLESDAIILRGAIAAKLPLAMLQSLSADGDRLEAVTNRGPLSLGLGAAESAAWLQRIQNPRSLVQKLGVERGMTVHVIDNHPEPQRVLAGSGATFGALDRAALVFIVIDGEAQLEALEHLAAALPPTSHLWVLRRKGKLAQVKESTLMARLAAQGLRPSKTTAWSDEYAADRYAGARVSSG